jgi:ATP-dependent phosphofructokinase / diphosphate-dependent phosphofructokinase
MKKSPPVLEGAEVRNQRIDQEWRHQHRLRCDAGGAEELEMLGLDYLIAIGGDDTLSYASELDRKGMKLIAVPKTMDNNVRNTKYCIGF